MLITLLFALAIGLVLGLLGGGGSILTVPVLLYVTGLDPKVAIAGSLPVVGLTSLVGAAGHWRLGNIALRMALPFGALTMIGGFAGARFAAYMDAAAQLVLLAIVMLGAAGSMLRRPAAARATSAGAPKAASADWRRLAPIALAVGVLTGLVGIGGGFLVVPALVLLGGVSMHEAVGTSLLVIALNAAASTAGYLGQVTLPLDVLVPFALFAIVGIVVGTALASRVSQQALRRSFALLLVVVGVFVLWQNRTVFTAPAPSVADASVR